MMSIFLIASRVLYRDHADARAPWLRRCSCGRASPAVQHKRRILRCPQLTAWRSAARFAKAARPSARVSQSAPCCRVSLQEGGTAGRGRCEWGSMPDSGATIVVRGGIEGSACDAEGAVFWKAVTSNKDARSDFGLVGLSLSSLALNMSTSYVMHS